MTFLVRNALLFLTIATLSPSLCFAQLNWLNDAFPSDQRTHDFGTVARAAKTEYRFQVKNTSDKTIELGGIRTSCGCTTPTIETKVIKPGETGTILAKFNTGSFTGQKQATVTVTVVKPVYTEVQLTVRGYIRSDVVVFPGSAAFGQVDQGNGKSLTLDVDYAGRTTWEVTNVTANSKFVDARVEEASRVNGRVKYKLHVDIKEDAPAGFLSSQLVLETNDSRLRTVPVALTADVQPAIQLSPGEFALGKIQRGKSVAQRLVVKSKEPFRVLSVSSDDIEVNFKPNDKAKKVHFMSLSLLAKDLGEGEHAGKLIVKTDMREEPLAIDLSYALGKKEITTAKKD